MGKISYKKLKGSQSLRQRLLLATLSSTPVLIEDIRADDMIPGLRPHEVSLLHLFEKVSDDCLVEINETGKYPHRYFCVYLSTNVFQGKKLVFLKFESIIPSISVYGSQLLVFKQKIYFCMHTRQFQPSNQVS